MSSAVIGPFRNTVSGCRVYQGKKKNGKVIEGKKKEKVIKCVFCSSLKHNEIHQEAAAPPNVEAMGWAVSLAAHSSAWGAAVLQASLPPSGQ